jgi:hypothetical protein
LVWRSTVGNWSVCKSRSKNEIDMMGVCTDNHSVFHLELAGMSLKPWVRGAMNWIVDREADKIKREREQEEKLLGPRCA